MESPRHLGSSFGDTGKILTSHGSNTRLKSFLAIRATVSAGFSVQHELNLI